jgi:hypothetical protein
VDLVWKRQKKNRCVRNEKLNTFTWIYTVEGRWHTDTLEQYEDASKSFQTGRLERELQMVQLSATRCSCIVILWVSLVSFAAITLCVASQRVFIVVVYFGIDSVRKLLDTPSCVCVCVCLTVTRWRDHVNTKTMSLKWLGNIKLETILKWKTTETMKRGFWERYRH